jgi:hypothetical protein
MNEVFLSVLYSTGRTLMNSSIRTIASYICLTKEENMEYSTVIDGNE